jgi:hypothetical protein
MPGADQPRRQWRCHHRHQPLGGELEAAKLHEAIVHPVTLGEELENEAV